MTPIPALLIAWAADEPHRTGEVALFEPGAGALLLGRGDSGGGGRVWFQRQRPGVTERTPPLVSPGLSREQLRVRVEGRGLRVDRIGKCALEVNGARVEQALVEPGDTLLLRNQLLLYCTTRPRLFPELRSASVRPDHAFGAPDAHGIVGESLRAWRLRDELSWTAEVDQHTLVLGESGSGKELCARAVHALSSRAEGPFVARNAATIPQGIADAELFGNVKGYPNPGMPERPGLIGAADGGTLFLDEIGELPHALQANLLRVLDEGGEYHKLGGASVSRSDLRLLGATNRDPASLKHDLAARLVLRVEVPRLNDRREDIPLLVRHLLGRAAQKSPVATRRFLTTERGSAPGLRVSASLIRHVLGLHYTTHLRELDAILWRAMSSSRGDVVDYRASTGTTGRFDRTAKIPSSTRTPPGGLSNEEPSAGEIKEAPPRQALSPIEEAPPRQALSPIEEAPTPTEEAIRSALLENGGNVVRTSRALGMTSRYALYRLLRKYAIDPRADAGPPEGASGLHGEKGSP